MSIHLHDLQFNSQAMFGMKRLRFVLPALVFFFVVSSRVGADVTTVSPTPLRGDEVTILRGIQDQLRHAISKRDFTLLKVKPQEKLPLTWKTCEKNSSVEPLSFEAMTKKLAELSGSKKISVNRRPEHMLSVTVVETKGWGEKSPYIYFDFTSMGKGWRWNGAYSCNHRDEEFALRRGAEMTESWTANGLSAEGPQETWFPLVKELQEVLSSGRYERLSVYIPKEPTIRWGHCGPGDSGPTELSIDAVQKLLVRQMSSSSINFNPPPNTEVDLLYGRVFVESEGWTGEYPYLGFGFVLWKPDNAWVWEGVCYSTTPQYDTRAGARYEPLYVREPQLPRPGPRAFNDELALRDRLQEIVRFKKFDAFRSYAVRNRLAFGLCQGDAKKKSLSIKGHIVSSNEVIEFLGSATLKSPVSESSSGLVDEVIYNAQKLLGWNASSDKGQYYGSPGRPIFEANIGGAYPYVAFWADQSKDGWEWSGVSYCKVPHRSLIFPDDPRYRQDKK